MESKLSTCIRDPIPTSLLKRHIDVLIPTVTRIVNISLTTGLFFSDWKTATVLPLLKKTGLCLVPGNYRPISNLPFLSKIAEKCVLLQFNPYAELNSLLPTQQSAYRKHHSTETAVIKLLDDILWSSENQQVTSLVTLDLSAAFDTVDHGVLLSILEKNFGVQDSALAWFTSYLCDRSMQVQVNDTLSSRRTISYSVPQGSVCGPVLFSCYTSTLPSVIVDPHTFSSYYADDTEIHRAFYSRDLSSEISNLASLVSDIENIKSWMDQNVLKLNMDKTEFIYFGSRQQLANCVYSNITIMDNIISRSTEIKYLGVWLDQELKFHKHIVTKCQIAAINIHHLRSIRKHLTVESAKQIASALVLSHLDYSNGVLIGVSDSLINRLQRIQNWAAKVVLGYSRYDSSSSALYQLHWLPIRHRIIFKVITVVFKCIHGTAPKYLRDLISKRQFTRVSRSASASESAIVLQVPFTRRDTFADRAFSVAGPRWWNDLPANIRSITDYLIFRKQLKCHLFNIAFNERFYL